MASFSSRRCIHGPTRGAGSGIPDVSISPSTTSRVDVIATSQGSPMVAATGGGSIGAAPRFALAPIDLDVELEVVDANLRPVVRNWGVRLDGSGRARLRITGSPSRPVVR